MRIRLPIARKLFFSHFLAVVLVSGSIGTFFYMSAIDSLTQNLKTRLKSSAAMVSQLIDANDLIEIRTEADQNIPKYRTYLNLLRDLKDTNADIAYLYIMRKEGDGDRVAFVIDSDATSKQALPGRQYDPVIPALLHGFSAPSVDDEIYTDEWGSFMSGYAPLKNGQGQYLVGIDMRADHVGETLRQVRISGIISFVFSIALALLFSRLLSKHFTTSIELLVSSCSAIAEGRLNQHLQMKTGDELDHLIHAFNQMSTQLEEVRSKNDATQKALEAAKEELEIRVEERTRDLLQLTEELKHEISERQKAEQALSQAAMSDPLTELLNRRAMYFHLQHALERFKRSHSPFCVLLCDLDHFKNVNDRFGHAAGDKVLKTVAQLLNTSTRGQDLVSRWGGEEFLLLLPDSELTGGVVLAERLRKKIENETIPFGEWHIQVTISIGVCRYQPGQTLESCIRAADEALYLAKHRGRNRTVAHEET